MRDPNQTLSEEIEQLVCAHLEATHRSVATAVERAFSSSQAPRRSTSRTTLARPTTSAGSGRRTASELSSIGEELYAAVCAHSGESMSVLAPAVGKTPRQLHRPMAALKQAGRVRSVGQRQQTRYYPMVSPESGT